MRLKRVSHTREYYYSNRQSQHIKLSFYKFKDIENYRQSMLKELKKHIANVVLQ